MTDEGGTVLEVVRTDAGYHGRFKAANHEVVWTTEVYESGESAVHAVAVLVDATRSSAIAIVDVDEREEAGT